MRLHSLALEGFGPFRERQNVDFDAFADDGIFLITGRTGAGKSSILDGVCFALYGSVPRSHESGKRLRSDHCAPEDSSEVVLEFSLGDRRLRATRAPEYSRPKRRGDGFTDVKQRAQLDEWADGAWVGRASGPRDVGLLLSELLGLTREQFLQVILLAQGRFAQFLLAGNDERQAVLRTLFGTRRYEDYEKALVERRKNAVAGVEDAERTIMTLLAQSEQLAEGDAEALLTDAMLDASTVPGADDASTITGADDAPSVDATPPARTGAAPLAVRIESLAAASVRVQNRVEVAEVHVTAAHAARDRAEADRAEGRRIADGQAALATEQSALAEREADAELIRATRAELASAQAAESLRAGLDADARRRRELAEALTVEQAARAALAATGFDDPDAVPTQLQAAVDGWIASLAAWQGAERLERELPDRRDARDKLSARIDEARRERSELEATLAAAPTRSAELDAQISDASEAAGAESGLVERIVADTARMSAAHGLVEAEKQLADADRTYATAAADADEAGKIVVTLLHRRLQGYAGELATQLRPGEPCGVCGGTDHPQPAAPSSDVVTDGDVSAAEEARDSCRATEAHARATATRCRERRNDLAERCGGATVAQLEERLADLRIQVDVAARARERRDALNAERAQRGSEIAAAGTTRDALGEEISAIGIELAAIRQSLADADAQIDAARGDADSVADRIATTTARRVAAERVLDAARTLAVAQSAAGESIADLADRLQTSGFADAAAAAAALRDRAEREALAARIAAHDQQIAVHRDRLRELERQALPTEPVDVVALQLAYDNADIEYRDAVARRAQAHTTSTTLCGLEKEVQAQQEANGALVAEAEQIARLADAISGRGANTHHMTLEAFVLAAELEQIVAQANVRLEDMSSGRYSLQHTDARAARNAASGLGIEVMDAHTGVSRPTSSLSGGETFLASLALALGLADVVTARAGGLRLDTLFIDEGFGSLDSETLETAMNTLESLRHGGRTVGVISHVEAMREQLPTQLRVSAGSHGPSRIEQTAPMRVG